MNTLLHREELIQYLKERVSSDWQHDEDSACLRRQFRFRDFGEAFGFMVRVAMFAEKLNHHPDWSNSWNRVDICLRSHDCKGISLRDIELAESIDAIFKERAL